MRPTTKTSGLLLLAALGAPASLMAQTAGAIQEAPAGKASVTDQRFVTNAAQGGMTEVALGKLASEKSSSAAVKNFGAQMVADHSKANQELAQLAGSKGIAVPSALDGAHQRAVDRLSALPSAGFDHAFMQKMLADHRQTIALFERESKSGRDSDLKAFASKTLPTLHEHLRMAQQAAK